MISRKLKNAVKLSDKRSYQIAFEAGLHPSTLSKIICEIEKVKQGDQRVIRIGNILGLQPEECFKKEDK